jgi:hypothetical protein
MCGKEKLGPIVRKHGYAASNADAPGGSLGLRLCDRSALRRTAGSKVSTVIDCRLTMSKGAVNGEPVGKATCGGAPTNAEPANGLSLQAEFTPGPPWGAGGETISR